jgi:hypothetical protein
MRRHGKMKEQARRFQQACDWRIQRDWKHETSEPTMRYKEIRTMLDRKANKRALGESTFPTSEGMSYPLESAQHPLIPRRKRNTNPGTSLLKLEGVDNTEAARWYAGKRVAYVYRAQKSVRGSKIRVIWGKITRPHGS